MRRKLSRQRRLGVRRPGLDSAAAAAKSLQSCPTLCDPIDSSPSGSSVHGIFQARVLEWGAIAFSHDWSCTHKLYLNKIN